MADENKIEIYECEQKGMAKLVCEIKKFTKEFLRVMKIKKENKKDKEVKDKFDMETYK